MEEENDLNYVFNEVPLYKKETFNILIEKEGQFNYNQSEYNRFLEYIDTENQKIITNCVWCDKEFSFDYYKSIQRINEYGDFAECSNLNVIDFEKNGKYTEVGRSRYMNTEPPFRKEGLKYENYYLRYGMNCSHNNKHTYYMTLFVRVEGIKVIIIKVGQYPSLLSVKGFNFDKYKKQLKKYNAYEDYKNADLSVANGFYAGAYTYLRRVYEKQLDYYVKKDNIQLTNNHTETKIKSVKNNFDKRITPLLENLYRILSKGIHELEEDESQDYYEYLKAIIDIQLQYEKELYEQEQQSKTLNKVISNIANKFSKKEEQDG